MFRILSGFLVTSFTLLTMAASAHAFTITVDEKADGFDGSVCTLRNAIETFNNQSAFGGCPFTDDAEPDTIVLLEGEYTLSIPFSDETISENSAGDLDIEVPLTITGQGVDLTSVSGRLFPANDADRIFELFSQCAEGSCTDLEATFHGFTIRDGSTKIGGGVLNSAYENRLTLDHMRLTNNFAAGGGGLYSYGEALIMDTTIDGNNANRFGGGLYVAYRSGTVLLNSTVNNNSAVAEGGGDGDGEASTGGALFGQGGGIYSESFLIVINSTVSGNQAGEAGGGIFYLNPMVEMAGAGVSGAGAKELPDYLFNVTIADNTVLNPDVGYGGGIAARSYYDLQIPTEVSVGGAAEIPAYVGVYNTLIARNQAMDAPDCFGGYQSGGFNLVGDPTDLCLGFDQTGDQTDVPDPGLGSLQDNGGPTQTQGLLAGSPAIDKGNDVDGCMALDIPTLIDGGGFNFVGLSEDQRHFPRPIAVLDPNNPICDIGAFEFQVFDFDVTKVDNVGGQTAVGNQFTYIITVTNSGPGVATSVLLTDPLPAEVSFNSVTSDQGTCMASGNTVECDLGTLNVGQTVTVQVLVTVVADGTFTNVVTVTSEGGDTQQSITKEAQTSTQSTGGGGGGFFFFGSGCQLAALPVTGASSLAYLGFALLGLGLWRRRSR